MEGLGFLVHCWVEQRGGSLKKYEYSGFGCRVKGFGFEGFTLKPWTPWRT